MLLNSNVFNSTTLNGSTNIEWLGPAIETSINLTTTSELNYIASIAADNSNITLYTYLPISDTNPEIKYTELSIANLFRLSSSRYKLYKFNVEYNQSNDEVYDLYFKIFTLYKSMNNSNEILNSVKRRAQADLDTLNISEYPSEDTKYWTDATSSIDSSTYLDINNPVPGDRGIISTSISDTNEFYNFRGQWLLYLGNETNSDLLSDIYNL